MWLCYKVLQLIRQTGQKETMPQLAKQNSTPSKACLISCKTLSLDKSKIRQFSNYGILLIPGSFNCFELLTFSLKKNTEILNRVYNKTLFPDLLSLEQKHLRRERDVGGRIESWPH